MVLTAAKAREQHELMAAAHPIAGANAHPAVARDLSPNKVAGWIGRLAEHGHGTALLHARTETEWFRTCWHDATTILFMARRLIFVKPDGMPCTTRSGERANSGAPPVLVAFGDYDAIRLREFASVHGGALVEKWQLFGAAALFSDAAE